MPSNSKNDDNEKTKKVRVSKKRRTKKTAKREMKKPEVKKSKKTRKKHPKLMVMLKIFIILFLLCTVMGAGIVAGVFFGLFGNDFEIQKKDLKIDWSNSVVVNEATGEKIADLSADEKRKIIKLDDMAEYLPKAYIAIEDERFEKHQRSRLKKNSRSNIKHLNGK